MKYSFSILPHARIEIRLHHAWMQKKPGHDSAEKWSEGIAVKIASLQVNPEMWPLVDKAPGLDFEPRVILNRRGRHVDRILYEIGGDTVYIHRVRHASQAHLTTDDF